MVWENLTVPRILNGNLDTSEILQKGEMVIHNRVVGGAGKRREGQPAECLEICEWMPEVINEQGV